ncbi:MAG: polysaccharide deacetylase family protein [Chitinispirillaceae bacterium]|nr:polysaccharide deacetylase family protein [Chitinispirillaceae bacterium]
MKKVTVTALLSKSHTFKRLLSGSVIVAGLVLMLPGTGRTGTVDQPYTVATWRGFTTAAVSYTFDDGCSGQFTSAIPMFDAKDFKLTLFTVTTGGMFPGWQKLADAAENGHEIASHTVTHGDLSGMNSSSQENELRNSQNTINENIPGKQCVTLAYPYCNAGTGSLCEKYYIASRTCSGQVMSKSPSDFNQISSILCGSTMSSRNSVAGINAGADDAAKSGGWCVYLFHGVGNDGGYSGVAVDVLQGCVDYMDNNRNKFWVESFGNVARYIKERNAVTVKETASAANSITVEVTDGLDDTVFNYPVSIRRPLPEAWDTAKVTQDEQPVEFSLKDSAGTKYVTFDALPDRGAVVISSGVVGSRKAAVSGRIAAASVVRFFVNDLPATVHITGIRAPVAVSFFSPAGKKLASGNLTSATCSFSLPVGMCIVRVTDGISAGSDTFLVP